MFSLLVGWRRVKRELAAPSLTQETSKKECDGGVLNLSAADFTEAFHSGRNTARSV
jgi:hypothetical protein